MPFFFHLKLELYPAPPVASIHHKRLTSQHTGNEPYIPPSNTNIFRTKLPTHSTSSWTTKRANTSTSSCEASQSQSPSRCPANDRADTGHGNALLLPERTLNLKDTTPSSPALTPAKRSNEALAHDWRYAAVSIESIDMQQESLSKAARGAMAGLHTKAVYKATDPATTEVGWGVVHLYRDTAEAALLRGDEQHGHVRKSADRTAWKDGEKEEDVWELEDCTTLCILAVPSWMMPSDLLGFVGDQAREEVSHFRLIRTGRANKYMVLMKFRSAKKAKEWQTANNGRLFSSAEPENCHVVFIRSVEFLTPDSDVTENDSSSFPQNMNDPFTPARPGRGVAAVRTSTSLTSKPLAPPPPNLRELPTCPVCLERMDETTGLLTILCQHVFHCACLEKWRGSGCPVCRYTHSPSYTFPYARPDGADTTEEEEEEHFCADCNRTDDLWVCLICGNVGCGRYEGAHARAHYEESSHCYSMNMSTQHVWDYAGDGWVHRLIQSKQHETSTASTDAPSRPRHENEAFRAEGADSVPREKMDSMAAEYTYLLTSQLEGQRRYFEEQVERSADKAKEAAARASTGEQTAKNLMASFERLRTEQEQAQSSLISLEARLKKAEEGRARFETLCRSVTSQLREEKTMTQGLLERIKIADEKVVSSEKEVQNMKAEVKDAQEMNEDLLKSISMQSRLEELKAEGVDVEDAGVEIGKRGKGKGRKR
ncbi:hypothetical protein LTR62_008686 [Meristemomyces frigidus]|uniref:Uncharacterized protein n=1 Tax=Meristemomyces frigidus TaxID=1508187 RepID=A0AAN7T9J3_9PEZI|nr:hypothetical protein LTR62_008686 [Meristemomyces frigidus]